MQEDGLNGESDLVTRINEELSRCFNRRKHGTASQVWRALGLNRNYFKDWRAGRAKIDVAVLEMTLELLDEDPLMFFMRALTYGRNLEQFEILEALEGASRRPSAFVAAIREKAKLEGLD